MAATPPKTEEQDKIDPNQNADSKDPETPDDAPKKPDPPKSPMEDPLLKSLFEDMGELPPVTPAEEEEDEEADDDASKKKDDDDNDPADQKDPKDDGDAPKDPDTDTDKPKKKVSFLSKDPVIDRDPKADPSPPSPEKQDDKPDDDAAYIESLTEEQKDELSEAAYAEKAFPQKYKNHRKKLLDWYKNLDSKVEDLRKDDPDRTFDANDDEFQKFLESKPKYEALDYKKLQRQIAREEYEQAQKPKLDALERKQRYLEAKPKIDEFVGEFEEGLKNMFEGEWVATLKEKGLEKAKEDFPLEAHVIESNLPTAKQMARDYILFANNLQDYDPKNENHVWLINFVNRQDAWFKANGGKKTVVDGRKFLTRAEYVEMHRKNPDQMGNYWTFGHREYLEMIARKIAMDIGEDIKRTREQAEKLGLAPKKKSSADPGKDDPDPEPMLPKVKASSRPSKGPAKSKEKPSDPSPARAGIDVVDILGLDSDN